MFDDYRPVLINDAGLVVGHRTDEIGTRTWRDGVFGGEKLAYDHDIRALNAEGRLAGFQQIGNAFTMFRRDSGWEKQELWSAFAYDINDAGSVVGESGYTRAMLWHGGQPHVLDHLWHETQYAGWYLRSAWDINAGGEILVSGRSEWDQDALFLLSPVPEPARWALLMTGVALLGGLRLRSGRRSA